MKQLYTLHDATHLPPGNRIINQFDYSGDLRWRWESFKLRVYLWLTHRRCR